MTGGLGEVRRELLAVERRMRALGGLPSRLASGDLALPPGVPADLVAAWSGLVDRLAADGVDYRGLRDPLWPGRRRL